MGGELFTPTEDDRVGRLFGRGVGTESWYEQQVLVCCAQTSNRCCTNQYSWRIGRLPDEKGLYHNTNSDKGFAKMTRSRKDCCQAEPVPLTILSSEWDLLVLF